jgi:hypothetical protein
VGEIPPDHRGRKNVVLDKSGVLRWHVVHHIPDARDQAEYQKVLASL